MLNYNTHQIRISDDSTIIILNYNPKPSNDLVNEIQDAICEYIRNIYIFIDMRNTKNIVDMQVDLFFRNVIQTVKSNSGYFDKIQVIYDSEQFDTKTEKDMIAYLLKYLAEGSSGIFTTNAGIGESLFKFDYFKKINEDSKTCCKLYLKYNYNKTDSFITWAIVKPKTKVDVYIKMMKYSNVEDLNSIGGGGFEEKGMIIEDQGDE